MIGSFHLYQIIIIIIAIFSLLFVYNRVRYNKSTPATFGLWCILWFIIVIFAFMPRITDPLASIFGIGRGLDLLVILGVIFCLYLIFRLYIKLDNAEQQMNDLVRKLAIENEIRLDEEE